MTKIRNVIKRKKYVPPVFEMILMENQGIMAGSQNFEAGGEDQLPGEGGEPWGAKGLVNGFTSFNLIADDYDAIDEMLDSFQY